MLNTSKHFETLSAQAIRNERPGDWGDFELLDVVQHFQNEKDEDHEIATLELLLRSPEISESVAYQELYFDLAESLRRRKEFSGAISWHLAAIAYNEQHEEGDNRANLRRELAETCLLAGDFAAGLGILTHNLLSEPKDVWNHNILALTLPDCGLADLSVEVLERGLALLQIEDEQKLQEQFKKLLQEAKAKSTTEKSQLAEISPKVLQEFRQALYLTQGATEGYAAYHAPLDQLITADESGYQTLVPEILERAKVFIPDLIRVACDTALTQGPAVERALTLLRQIADHLPTELSELTQWLKQADAQWLYSVRSSSIGKVGGFANSALESIAADTKYNIYVRNDAAEALLERREAGLAPTDEVITFMRQLLTRPESYDSAEEETFLGFFVCTLGDYNVQELYPEIEALFREDRIDPQITDLDHIREDFGWAVTRQPVADGEEGLSLLLKCTVCGRERLHSVQFVTIDTGTSVRKEAGQPEKYDAHIMDHEIICPKCGARDQYELTPMASLRLLLPTQGLDSFVGLLTGKKDAGKFKPHPRVQHMQSFIMGKPMNPLEGIDRYREMIAKEPRNAGNYVRLGNILRVIHRYPQALEAFQKGYQLDRSDPDCILSYAMAEHDFGDPKRAKELYQETLTLVTKSFPPSPAILEAAPVAQQGLQALEKRKGSQWDVKNNKMPQTSALPEKRQATASSPNLSKSQIQALKKKKRKQHKGRR